MKISGGFDWRGIYDGINSVRPSLSHRPIIGITGNLREQTCTLAEGYYRSVLLAGGVPVVIPPYEQTELLADQLEARKKELNSLNSSLSSDLFYLLNNMNIRHNNIDSNSTSYKKGVADMPEEELEEWYDRTYDICLYAFMTLDQAERNAKIKELKKKIEDSKE